MKKMIVNSKEITTNYGADRYPLWDGEGKETMDCFKVGVGQTADDLLRRLADEGYTRVTFYEVTTCVRGYHHIYAFAKRNGSGRSRCVQSC